VSNQKEEKKKKAEKEEEEEEKEEEAKFDMVSIISFIQDNVQHSIAASRALTRTVVVQGIDTALIPELWYCEGHFMGLNVPGYTLFYRNRIDRPRECILMWSIKLWMPPGFSSMDPVAVLLNYNEGEAERCLVVCSAYLPYASEDPPLTQQFEELLHACEVKNFYLVIG